jgi:hypothetical protein
MSGGCSDNKVEGSVEISWEYLKHITDALNRLFKILFSCEGMVVRGIYISVSRTKTLRSFMSLTEGQPPVPREVIAVEVSATLEFQEPLDLDYLAGMVKDMKDAGFKASLSTGELNVEVNIASIPLM